MNIQKSDIISAQVLKVEFAPEFESWIIKCVQKQTDGSYNLYNSWTNSTDKPIFTIGQSVLVMPELDDNGKHVFTKKGQPIYHVLPA